MPEAAAGGALWKKVFFKISQNTQETPAPNKTPVSFSKFVRTPFLHSNSRRLLLKCRHCKNEAREIDFLCNREVNAMLIALAKIPECKRSISPSSFHGHLPNQQSNLLALYSWYTSSFYSWRSGMKQGGWLNLKFYLFVSGVNEVVYFHVNSQQPC